MLDDYQDMGNTAAFLDELEEEEAANAAPKKSRRKKEKKRKSKSKSSSKSKLTPFQLFIISIELFAMVAILGMFFMIITQKMVISL